MSSLRLGAWLLIPSHELEHQQRERVVELDHALDVALSLRRELERVGARSLRLFARELERGAPYELDDELLVAFVISMVVRRHVRLIDLTEPPMASDEVTLGEHVPEPMVRENVIEEVEFVDWDCELETDEPVWFEVESDVEDLPVFEVESGVEDLPMFEVETELEDLPVFETELNAGSAPK